MRDLLEVSPAQGWDLLAKLAQGRDLPAESDVLLDYQAPAGPRPVAVASDGLYYTLADGRRILDASGLSVASVGHSDSWVAEVMAVQAAILSFCARQFTSPPQLLLAGKLGEITPGALGPCWFGPGGGAVGVESAVHLAYQYFSNRGESRRCKVIAHWGSYHGGTGLTTSAGGYPAHRDSMEPYLISPEVMLHAPPLPNDGGSAEAIAGTIDDMIRLAGPESVAAVLIEPVTGSLTGALTGPPGWVAAVRQVCDDHGVLLIADETMCGFGRTGAWFATGRDPGEAPDILVAGKLMTGGHFPFTAVTATEEIFQVVREKPGGWSVRFTNAGHPVGCAVALAVIDRIERDGLLANAAIQGEYLRGLLSDLDRSTPHLGPPTGAGLQLGVPVHHCPGSGKRVLEAVTELGRDQHGILVTGGLGVDGDTLKLLITPSLTIKAADCDKLAARLAATVDHAIRVQHAAPAG